MADLTGRFMVTDLFPYNMRLLEIILVPALYSAYFELQPLFKYVLDGT